jgi:aspartate 1-decarboxylase
MDNLKENSLFIEMLKGKIHRATVTEADLNYIGSLTLDEDLMDAAGLREYEKIGVLDITNGNRIDTYIISGERGSGKVCINGAAAHLISKDDLVIIVAYCQLNETEAQIHKPKIVHVNSENHVTFLGNEEPVLV